MSICPLTKADSHNGLPHKRGAEVDVAKIGVDYLAATIRGDTRGVATGKCYPHYLVAEQEGPVFSVGA